MNLVNRTAEQSCALLLDIHSELGNPNIEESRPHHVHATAPQEKEHCLKRNQASAPFCSGSATSAKRDFAVTYLQLEHLQLCSHAAQWS